MSAGCLHANFTSIVIVTRLTNENDVVEGFTADVQVRCVGCGTLAVFPRHLPMGVSRTHPTVNVDRTELRVPIAFLATSDRLD